MEKMQSDGIKIRIPKQVIIETSASCQLRCEGCPINGAHEGGFMKLTNFLSIIDRIDFDTTIIPWMNGEPLLHKDYAAILQILTERNLRAYVTTNGMIWNDAVMQIMAAKNSIYQIIFSLDGHPMGWSNSQMLCRPGSREKTIVDNIRRFGKLKEGMGNNIDIAVKICRRGQDQAEVEKYIVYWLKEHYIDYVCEGKMLWNDQAPEVRTHPCRYPDDMFMVIRSDGQMVPCAYNHEVVNENYFKWPNVFDDREKPMLEYYNDPKLQDFRKKQELGIYPGPCATCGFAYTGEGFEGGIQFRDPMLRSQFPNPIYWHSDYYNQFYSLTRKWKPAVPTNGMPLEAE